MYILSLLIIFFLILGIFLFSFFENTIIHCQILFSAEDSLEKTAVLPMDKFDEVLSPDGEAEEEQI